MCDARRYSFRLHGRILLVHFDIYIEISCYQVVDLSLDNVLKPGTALPSGKQSKLPLLKRLAVLTLKMMFSKNLELVIRRVQMDFSFPSSLLILG